MRQSIHTRSSSQPFRHRIHQFRVHNSHCRNVIRVYANHFLTGIFVDNHAIDSHFGSSSCGSRQCEGRHSLMFGIGHPFQRFHICEIRIVHYNTNTFCRINRRTTTQCHDKISTGSFICSHTILYIGNSRIGFYITVKFIRNLIVVEYFDDFGSYTELDKVFICNKKGFLKATSSCFHSNYTPATCAEIRSLI